MSVLIVFMIIIGVIFAAAFLSARRFGVLALGLAAGSVLASLWGDSLAIWMIKLDVDVSGVSMGAVSTAILQILPIVILVLSGPRYYSKFERILSALAIGVLTAAFLVQPLGKFMVLQSEAASAYNWLAGIWQYVVTVGLAMGIIDLFLLHSSKKSHSKKH